MADFEFEFEGVPYMSAPEVPEDERPESRGSCWGCAFDRGAGGAWTGPARACTAAPDCQGRIFVRAPNCETPHTETAVPSVKIAVGDVNSDKRGSAARYNAGKPDLSLIPLRAIYETLVVGPELKGPHEALGRLAAFQETQNPQCLIDAMNALDSAWAECAQVLEYGIGKYAPWNWAKGQAWSVALASAARHLVFGILQGEEVDPESGKPHRGHVMANLVFLHTFVRTYPEGNDLPKGLLHTGAAA